MCIPIEAIWTFCTMLGICSVIAFLYWMYWVTNRTKRLDKELSRSEGLLWNTIGTVQSRINRLESLEEATTVTLPIEDSTVKKNKGKKK